MRWLISIACAACWTGSTPPPPPRPVAEARKVPDVEAPDELVVAARLRSSAVQVFASQPSPLLYGPKRLCGAAAQSELRRAAVLLQLPTRQDIECVPLAGTRVWCEQRDPADPVIVVVETRNGWLQVQGFSIGEALYAVHADPSCIAP